MHAHIPNRTQESRSMFLLLQPPPHSMELGQADGTVMRKSWPPPPHTRALSSPPSSSASHLGAPYHYHAPCLDMCASMQVSMYILLAFRTYIEHRTLHSTTLRMHASGGRSNEKKETKILHESDLFDVTLPCGPSNQKKRSSEKKKRRKRRRERETLLYPSRP